MVVSQTNVLDSSGNSSNLGRYSAICLGLEYSALVVCAK